MAVKNMQSTPASSQPHAALTRYLLSFLVLYLVFGTIFAVVVALLKVKANGNSLGGIALMLAVMPTMSQFVKHQRRAMFTAERLRFAMWATALMFASSAATYSLYVIATGNAHLIGYHLGRFMVELQRYPFGGPVLLAVCVLIPFVMLYFATGLFGKQALRMQSGRIQSSKAK
jgi:hypothetical protein